MCKIIERVGERIRDIEIETGRLTDRENEKETNRQTYRDEGNIQGENKYVKCAR